MIVIPGLIDSPLCLKLLDKAKISIVTLHGEVEVLYPGQIADVRYDCLKAGRLKRLNNHTAVDRQRNVSCADDLRLDGERIYWFRIDRFVIGELLRREK